MPTAVPGVLAYLVTLFDGSPLLGQASPAVNVIDGPKTTGDPGNLALWVGVDDITNPAPTAATSAQARAGLGHRAAEDLSVHCVAQAKSGGDDIVAMRAAAAGIVAAVETVVAGDFKLGGTVSSATAGAAADWRQGPNPQGAGVAAQVLFTIDCKALPEP